MLQQDAAAAKPNPAAPIEHAAETESAAEPTLDVDNLKSTTQEPVGDVGKVAADEEAAESNEDFSRFDQGPLTDQPAFVPEETEDEAVEPSPVARRTQEVGGEKEANGLTRTASPGVQDRWAQIRKNAANRAAQRQTDERDRSMPPSKSATDGDEDTSGEETIESRVARIKARVAELTGNMEGTNAPPLKQTSA
ncbi:hypothetical protein NLG97_g11264 [Lecanicillium saksenae]|uniref:Uncharacterized protein n=1 Tax=Lecanicillium saksenae TaxID=468837 RepID=A0ACC1QEP9_9HYPO|nr:hypothetical protein NLG97_g11264 [Lecanicillium saksenae]